MPTYSVYFKPTDTGLTPTFTKFVNRTTLVDLSPGPAITEVTGPGGSFGEYRFTYTPTVDVSFTIDGGAGLPSTDRYQRGVLSPEDGYLDQAISASVTSIRGVDSRDLTELAGAGFVTGTDSLKIISDNVDAINVETDAASIAAAVWNSALSAHTTVGSFGQTLQLEDSGLAQNGAAGTVTLRAGASAVTDFYKNGLIAITSGTGAGQSRSITAYDGATKIATVDRNWGTTPIAGDGYIVLPAAPSASSGLTNSSIAGAVWDEALAGHLTAGSTGAKLNAGSVGTPYVQFTANGDTILPVIIQVASPTHTTVRVTYSEPVVMTTGANGALNVGNYTIPGLTITGVTSLTAQQVLLTTSAQTPNFLYTLSVVNVEDTQGNPIA